MIRATAAGIGFSLIGFIAVLIRAPNSRELVPDALFYGVLILHTFFSVRFFSRVIAQDSWQIATDLALVAVYLALALSLGDGLRFLVLALCLFALAISKYMPSLRDSHLKFLMRRKIKYEIGGIVLSGCSITIALLMDQTIAVWFFTIVYAAVTFDMLFNRGVYSLKYLPKIQLANTRER